MLLFIDRVAADFFGYYCRIIKKGLTQYLSYLNPKGEDSSCKINGFMAKYFIKTKMSLTLLILKINTTFEDVQMMLK